MEADAALILTTTVYEEYGLKKHPDLFLGYEWPRTSKENKKNKDVLPLHIPESGWLADPTH
eukprot:614113-Ditylum_brightwellii.AAC.1